MKYGIIASAILMIATNSISQAQGGFMRADGRFVIHNVVALNLVAPGSGSIVYATQARKQSKARKALRFAWGIGAFASPRCAFV